MRTASGLTQTQVAERLGQTQAFVSRCERGDRRLDVIELREFCGALGIPYLKFLKKLESELIVLKQDE